MKSGPDSVLVHMHLAVAGTTMRLYDSRWHIHREERARNGRCCRQMEDLFSYFSGEIFYKVPGGMRKA